MSPVFFDQCSCMLLPWSTSKMTRQWKDWTLGSPRSTMEWYDDGLSVEPEHWEAFVRDCERDTRFLRGPRSSSTTIAAASHCAKLAIWFSQWGDGEAEGRKRRDFCGEAASSIFDRLREKRPTFEWHDDGESVEPEHWEALVRDCERVLESWLTTQIMKRKNLERSLDEHTLIVVPNTWSGSLIAPRSTLRSTPSDKPHINPTTINKPPNPQKLNSIPTKRSHSTPHHKHHQNLTIKNFNE